MKKTSFILVILTVIISCKKEVEVYFSEANIESTEVTNIALNFPKAEGSKEVANRINKTLQNYIVSQINLSEDSLVSETIEDAVVQFNAEFNNFKRDFPETHQQWEAFIDGEVTYQSPEIISVAINTYLDTGGAHGNTTVRFLNFNPLTGALLTKKDLINATEPLSKIVKHYLKQDLESNSASEGMEDYFFGKDFQFPESIGFSDEGLIILYNPYEIATYAQGIIEFTIPYEEISSYLNLH